MNFAEAMRRIRTDPGTPREELPAMAEGLMRLTGREHPAVHGADGLEVLRSAPDPGLGRASPSPPDGYWIES